MLNALPELDSKAPLRGDGEILVADFDGISSRSGLPPRVQWTTPGYSSSLFTWSSNLTGLWETVLANPHCRLIDNSSFAPDVLSHFDYQRQLAHLLVFAECVTAGHAGKPTLGANG